jgi:hypothetical protein
MSVIGLDSSIKSNGVLTEDEITKIIDSVNIERLNNNPVCVSKDMLREVLL